MKLLVCVAEYYPDGSGIANVAYNLVERLKQMGVDCTVCSPTGPDIKIDYVRGYGRASLLHFWRNVSLYFKRNPQNFDAVWLHNPLMYRKMPFQKCITTIHTTPYGQRTSKMYPWHIHLYKIISTGIDKYCLNRINTSKVRFIAISNSVKAELDAMGIKNAEIIPNGTDTRRFKPAEDKGARKEKFGLSRDSRVIISVGRISPSKMPFRMIDLFRKIESHSDKYVLCVSGKGILLDDAKEYARSKDLKNLRFLGFVPDADLPDLYSCADYYLMTSVYEGQPLTLLDALASGLPCIVSDIPGVDILSNIDCNLLVDFNRADAADLVIDYLERDNSQHALNARKYAVDHLNWDIIAKQYYDLFNMK